MIINVGTPGIISGSDLGEVPLLFKPATSLESFLNFLNISKIALTRPYSIINTTSAATATDIPAIAPESSPPCPPELSVDLNSVV